MVCNITTFLPVWLAAGGSTDHAPTYRDDCANTVLAVTKDKIANLLITFMFMSSLTFVSVVVRE